MPETNHRLAGLFSNLEHARAEEERLTRALKVASDKVRALEREISRAHRGDGGEGGGIFADEFGVDPH